MITASTLDRLRTAKTPRGFANAIAAYLKENDGLLPANEVAVWSPKDPCHFDYSRGLWTVVVEGGPFEWSIYLSMSGSLYSHSAGIDFDPFRVNPRFYLEAANGFAVSIIEV